MSDYTRITDRKIELTDEGVEELIADYTPTTGHVRARYVRDDANFLADWAEFDRWLAEVKAEAWEEGLEAKFKLLEGQESVSLYNPYRQGESE